jgi:hypothetical protein
MNDARDLSARLSELLRLEHGAMADFLVALADFDRRRLWVELGYPSLFYFLHRELGLSKGAAYYRKTAAELVQRFPEVIPPLRDGRLCITSIVELGKVLTAENRDEVLPQFFHRSKREAREGRCAPARGSGATARGRDAGARSGSGRRAFDRRGAHGRRDRRPRALDPGGRDAGGADDLRYGRWRGDGATSSTGRTGRCQLSASAGVRPIFP